MTSRYLLRRKRSIGEVIRTLAAERYDPRTDRRRRAELDERLRRLRAFREAQRQPPVPQ